MLHPHTTPKAKPVQPFGRLTGAEVDAWATDDVFTRVEREIVCQQNANAAIAADAATSSRVIAEAWVDALQFALSVIREERAR